MPNFVDLRAFVAEEIQNLHERLDVLHQRFHTLADEWVQEGVSQFAAGNNPLFSQAQHNAPGGYTPTEPTSTPEEGSSTPSSSDPSASSPSSSSSSSASTAKSSDSSGTSQPK